MSGHRVTVGHCLFYWAFLLKIIGLLFRIDEHAGHNLVGSLFAF